MGANLTKTPLTAVLYAALFTFVLRLLPVSQILQEAQAAFVMPVLGYVWMIVYGLLVSLIMTVFFSQAKDAGVKALLFCAVLLLWFACVGPAAEFLAFGHPGGLLTPMDIWMQIAASAVAVLFILVLGMMLMKGRDDAAGAQKPQAKYKINVLQLVIKLIVCPLVFCLFYVLAWYFLAWRVDAVRLFYMNGVESANGGFMIELIAMLTGPDVRMVPFSLVLGLAYALLSMPLLLQFPGKRVMFMALNVMLYLCAAVCRLIPSAAAPDAVRMSQLIRYAVLFLVYGLFTGIMLHTSIRREAVPEPKAAPDSKTDAKPAAGAARPAPARR